MSTPSLLDAATSLTCDLCGQTHPAQEVAMRGKLNFCQRCAYERASECLGLLQGKKHKRSWLASIACGVGLGLAAGSGWWGWTTFHARYSPAAFPSTAISEPDRPEASIPERATPPVPAPTSQTASGETTWIQRLFTDRGRQSVADAGHINLLFVTRPGTDSCRGLSSQLFITREAPREDAAKLMTEVGEQMATSFEEGLRYVRKQPRGWEREFSVRLSFEDKFSSKDGGSAGTGFTIAMLSAIQGILLDPTVAVTGDLTVDGTVQPVGGVIEKLRGAIEGKCKITLIPERNSRDVTDLALIDGSSPLWETQILSIGTIDQALGLARQDRTEASRNALAKFQALRARLPAVVTPNYLQSPIVLTELREVLRAAPNHLSAAVLLRVAEGQLPQELSLNRSVDEILAASHLFVSGVINPSEESAKPSGGKGITVFPEREFGACYQKLQRLTPILDRRSLELKSACLAYAGALRATWTYQPADANAWRTRYQMNDVVRREKKLQQLVTDDLDGARSRLLLAVRKLDTDGSLVSELKKK